MGIVYKRTTANEIWHWEGVEIEGYTQGATRQVLIGEKDGAPNFVLRYFSLPPHGLSNLDYHEHDHGVVVMSGHARVMLGDRYEEIEAGDVVYIPGWEKHQFENLGDDPFTFLCVIPPKTAKPDMCVLPETKAIGVSKQAD